VEGRVTLSIFDDDDLLSMLDYARADLEDHLLPASLAKPSGWRDWAARNPDRARAARAAERARNIETIRESRRAWKRRNRDRVNAAKREARARSRSLAAN